MTRMTGPDCAVMCNFINIHTCMQRGEHNVLRAQIRIVQVGSVSLLSGLIRGFRNKYH